MTRLDYSRPTHEPCPHDLLFVAADALSADCPEWARACIEAGAPVVTRRAPRGGASVPIGVRGGSRGQRHAGWIQARSIVRMMTPESLIDRRSGRVPALAGVESAGRLLASRGHRWGVTGAVGYELATGERVCHTGSDLDLLVRLPQRMCRREARELYAELAALAVRCDVQLETPIGAVALADWAGAADRCLIKTDAGPLLSPDPWGKDHGAVRAPCRQAIG